MERSFDILGDSPPASPVVLSVPHAGRIYPPSLHAALRVPAAALVALEDRHVDTVALGARQDETMLVQRIARAWIDLNRGEDERDPLIDAGARGGHRSMKVRSGLGLVPRRTGAAGDLWLCPMSDADVMARITDDYRPYHQALDAALRAARDRFGAAVLLDVHSMPPLAQGRARVVLGDRFGSAAGGRFLDRAACAIEGCRMPIAINSPYAGGHLLQRHGDPRGGVHAIQIEIDRTLYLDRRLDGLGHGLTAATGMLRAVIDALCDEALGGMAQAAE